MTRMTQGRERFNQWGWLWRRTHRLAMLLMEPGILAGAVQLVEGMDRWADHNKIDRGRVTIGDAKFVRGLDYIEMPLVTE